MIYAIGPIYIKERSNSEMQSHIDAEVRLYKSNYHYSMVHQEIACIYITVSLRMYIQHEKALFALANALVDYETLSGTGTCQSSKNKKRRPCVAINADISSARWCAVGVGFNDCT